MRRDVSPSEGLTVSKGDECPGEGAEERCGPRHCPLAPHPLSHPLMRADEPYRRPRRGQGWSLRSPGDISSDLIRWEAWA